MLLNIFLIPILWVFQDALGKPADLQNGGSVGKNEFRG